MPSYEQMYGNLPSVTALTPATVVAGSGAFTLSVAGSGFVNGAVVTLDAAARTTTFGSATQLSATILASDVASAGTHSVAVTNPAGGGGSNGLVLTVATPATVTLSPTTWNPVAGGGTQVIAVTVTPASGTWTTSSSQAWVTLSSSGGAGNGSVTLTAASTTSTTTRTAIVTIGGKTLTVTQAAGTVTLSPTSWTAPAAGGATTVSVTVSPASVHWTAVSNQTWLTVSPPSGDGSGAATLTAAAKVGKSTKNATVTIGGLSVTVKQ